MVRILAALLILIALSLQPDFATEALSGSTNIFASVDLTKIVGDVASQTLERFKSKDLRPDQLAITFVDLRSPTRIASGSFHGEQRIYPASVIKLFYLVAIHRWMEDGKVRDSEELRRAMRDMIVESYNEATGLVLDTLTDTTSGPELPRAELDNWFDKRQAVNRYFTTLNFTNINACRKPWCEGPYGREMQSMKVQTPGRNALTTDATARLLSEISLRQAVTPNRCDEMLALLSRDPFDSKASPNEQARAFTGSALSPGTKLWSKAGWTSETRHDAALVELPTGEKFVLVTFTTGHANDHEIIPYVARAIIDRIRAR